MKTPDPAVPPGPERRAASVRPVPLSASRWRWLWNLHPLAFALFPVLSLYAANLGEVPPGETLRPLILILGAALLLALTLLAVVRHLQKAAVVLSLFLLFFFAYGHLAFLKSWADELLIFFGPRAINANPHLYLFPLWLALFVGVSARVLRSRRDFQPITSAFALAGVVLVVAPLVTIAANPPRYLPAAQPADQGSLNASVPTGPAPGSDAAPDIYYIILDAYGRQDQLKNLYGYDNEPFLRELERRGFYVARRGRANYAETVFSLASSLNMVYLDDLARKVGRDSSDLTPLSRMIDESAVAAFLRKRGYRFISLPTGYPLTATPSADLVLGSAPQAEYITGFEGLLLDSTPLTCLPRARRTLFDQHRNAVLSAFAHLSQVPRLPERKFVFAHLLVPHPPFVFGPNGEPIAPDRPFTLGDATDFMARSTPEVYRRQYIDQLQYVNRRVLRAIDDIRARSVRPPIIIVQGDHGSRMRTDWKSLERTYLPELFANLNAICLPDPRASARLYQGISPVNSFRLVLNGYFGARYERLPDRSFYSTLQKPYAFTDVTERTRANAP